MSCDAGCIFCEEIRDNETNVLGKSRTVLETDHFIVFPTVGCFKIGYLLVTPKEHIVSFGELDLKLIDELEEIIHRLISHVEKKEGVKCIIFEHGTRNAAKLSATSIFHAHIHIVPINENILSFLPNECRFRKVSGFSDLRNEQDNYLFLRDTFGNNYIIENNNYPSQFLRKIVCDALGISEVWDWKAYPFIENMERTIHLYEGIQ